ncbi:hypothetical protein [Streptomyces sp. NRRL WC-3725]|uniref:hypothetical protein n=1 Tax=Streptomyces sp. NRRL WC-3725 TaxID=1463933 RepID=UPI0004C74DD7|nr:MULTISPECIES: hypothetical protein [Streptomyces]KOG62492.1 hypothetical protein ADK77_27190 [Streptomyces antibioticus]
MVVPTPGAPLAVSGAPLFDASAPVYVVQGEGCTVLVDAGTGPVRLEFIAVGGALPDELAGSGVALAPAPEGGLSRTVVEAARPASWSPSRGTPWRQPPVSAGAGTDPAG